MKSWITLISLVAAGDSIGLKMVTIGTETIANVRATWEKE
jgi:hypothetical protein